FRVANSPVEFYGNVVVSGTLQNHTAGSYEASIFGSLINKGIINNIIYNFTIDLYGDLYNHGTWTNYDVNLESSDIQNFYTYAPVSMVNLDNTNQDGILKAQTNLMFSGVDIDLFDDTLAFDQGSELILSNTAFYRGKVINEGPESSLPLVLDLSSNSYIRNSEFVSDSIILKGTVQIYGSPMNFHGNVANLGTLTGFPTGTHTAYFIGNLSNLGTIKNQIYVLNVYISGNMHNEGTWNNTNTYLNGTSLQYISMSEALETANFTNLNGSDMMAVSDLVFDNTDIDLNGADFTIGEDLNVFIKDGFIRECSMISNHFNLGMSGSYCRDIAIGNVSLFGEIKTYLTNNTFTGDVVVEGTLSSSGFGSSTVTFQGNVTNNGSISNSTYVLNVIALGDLTNNGTWNNYNTRLDGTADDQHITLVNSKPIVSQVTFDANLTTGTTFAWAGPSGYLSAFPAEFTGANTQVVSFLNPVVDADVGEYYCSNDAFDESRKIYIHSTSVPEYQLDLTLLLEGPYNGSEMNTTLNSSDNLPLAQPYYDYPWIYPGSEAVGSIPSADVVDWVYLELHDASSAGSADESTQFDRLIGLLLKDGSVVDLDGSSLPDFNGPINNGLFVNVLHRNHLGVLSATALTESGGIYSYDFTSGNGQAYGSNVQTDLGGGLYGLRGGDADKDGDVDATDYDIWASEAGNKAGYNNTDFNLDTEIDNKDKNEAQFGNLGISAK
ncbi:MAG: hypothetical protein KDC05_00325, partial [Bacteroidales bacterium]|nr:hypothetical protein [Bacteroidales bacterium]